MNNMDIYNKVREVPLEAQKEIKGGRLSGMTDINPMWRIKALTEQFGICGVGWWFEVTDKRFEAGGNNQIAAFVDINLYVKVDGEWSKPIPGTGGSMFVANESKGLHTSDECFKMAQTDALSVACKALGVGADIYWQKDKTKYGNSDEPTKETAEEVFDPKLKDTLPDDGYKEPKSNTISQPQQGRLFAKAGYDKNDKDSEMSKRSKVIVETLLKAKGYKSTGEIKAGDEYKEFCDKAEVMLAEYLVPS